MNWVIVWVKNPDNWNAILHNVIANVVVAVAAGGGFMFWTYIHGLPLPYVVLAGIVAPGAVLFTIRQVGDFFASQKAILGNDENAAFRKRLDAIEGELAATKARQQSPVIDPKELKRQQDKEYNEKRDARKAAKLADVKAVIREQIDAAPKVYDLDEVQAWMAATDLLLGRMQVPRVTENISHGIDEKENKKRFQRSIASLRSLLATLTINDMHHVF